MAEPEAPVELSLYLNFCSPRKPQDSLQLLLEYISLCGLLVIVWGLGVIQGLQTELEEVWVVSVELGMSRIYCKLFLFG